MSGLDSGFFTKKEGLPLLLQLGLADTTDSLASKTWQLTKAQDTVGKFYRTDQTGNLLVLCLANGGDVSGEDYLLLELSPEGQVLQKRRYFLGKYPCCLQHENFYNGLSKKEKWLLLTGCNTGSGFCAGFLNVFNQTLPPSYDKGILASLYDATTPPYEGQFEALRITSTAAWHHDTLLMQYTQKRTFSDENENVQEEAVERFDINYVQQGSGWRALDSTRLKELLLRL